MDAGDRAQTAHVGVVVQHGGHEHHRHDGHDGNVDMVTLNEVDLAKLTEEERWAYDHQLMHVKHRGHEAMHLEMMLVLIVTLVVAQVALVQWKRRHFKSYQVGSHAHVHSACRTGCHAHMHVAHTGGDLPEARMVEISVHLATVLYHQLVRHLPLDTATSRRQHA